MSLLEKPRDGKRLNTWRSALVILAVCALTVNVVTRYSTCGSRAPSSRTISVLKSNVGSSQTQRLLSNGLPWIAPAPAVTFLEPPKARTSAISALVPAIHLDSESWLYNRPPPVC